MAYQRYLGLGTVLCPTEVGVILFLLQSASQIAVSDESDSLIVPHKEYIVCVYSIYAHFHRVSPIKHDIALCNE